MTEGVKIEQKNAQEFAAFLHNATKQAGDLRVAWGLIAKSQFKFQRQIFQLKGPGKYQDLSPKYKLSKQRAVGFIYPILFRKGRLAYSLLQPGGENILRISPTKLFFGTSVPYAGFHQFGTKNLPIRPFLFIDEQRARAWRSIVLAHLKKGFSKPTLGAGG